MSKSTQDKVIIGLLIAIVIMAALNVGGFFMSRPKTAETQQEVSQKQEETEEAADDETVSDTEEVVESDSDSEEIVESDTEEVISDTEGTAVEFNEDADYILADSHERYYTEDELSGLTKNQLAIARNEIYARHGYIFKKNQTMKKYFEGKSWYKGTKDNVPDSDFNVYEKANIDLIVNMEKGN